MQNFYKTGVKIFFGGLAGLFAILLFSQKALAQATIPSDNETLQFEIDIFPSTYFTNLREFGVLYLLGQVVLFVFTVFFVIIFFNFVGVAFKFFNSAGDAGAVQEGWKSIRVFLFGNLYTLAFIIIFAVLAAFMGLGNFFGVLAQVGQCGDGGFLFASRFRLLSWNENSLEEGRIAYCCGPPVTNQLPEGERGIEGTLDLVSATTTALGTDTYFIGSEETAWGFAEIPPGLDKDDNLSVLENDSCRFFTVID